MTIQQKLLNIQSKLKAPKSQYNSFGKYNYRNCEDILEAVKPLCVAEKAVLFVEDTIVNIGDRFYVKAIATLADTDTTECVEITAYAREEETKKGMDGSQITGASSSYARKYALNGLFCIDDTKDSDSTNKGEETKANKTSTSNSKPAEKTKRDRLAELINHDDYLAQEALNYMKKTFNKIKANDLNDEEFADLQEQIEQSKVMSDG